MDDNLYDIFNVKFDFRNKEYRKNKILSIDNSIDCVDRYYNGTTIIIYPIEFRDNILAELNIAKEEDEYFTWVE